MGTAAVRVNAGVIGTPRADRPLRTGLVRYVLGGSAKTLLSTPLIYSLIIPLALLDTWVTLYQRICFAAWGMAHVRRGPFFVIDRHELSYLNVLEKLNCTFCSYANGVFAYAREVGARTEQYWCPIKHARRPKGVHRRYERFSPFGDDGAYHTQLSRARKALAPDPRE
jgi:hypothetical protein